MHPLMARGLKSRLCSGSHLDFHRFQARICDNAVLSQSREDVPEIHCKTNPQRTPWSCQPNVSQPNIRT
jgi:hypothetical protein